MITNDHYELAELGWPPRSATVRMLIGRGYGEGLCGCEEDIDTQAVVYETIGGDYILFVNGESLVGYEATEKWHIPIEEVVGTIKEYCGKWSDRILEDLKNHLDH